MNKEIKGRMSKVIIFNIGKMLRPYLYRQTNSEPPRPPPSALKEGKSQFTSGSSNPKNHSNLYTMCTKSCYPTDLSTSFTLLLEASFKMFVYPLELVLGTWFLIYIFYYCSFSFFTYISTDLYTTNLLSN